MKVNDFKIGDKIVFGYKKVWHIKKPKAIQRTKNDMIIVRGTCLNNNGQKIKGILVKYCKNSRFGCYLTDIIKEYSDINNKFECSGGGWQYRNPYLTKL